MRKFVATCVAALLGACSGGGGGGPESEGTELPLETTSVEFGQSGIGSPTTRTLELRNPKNGRTVTVTGVEITSSEVTVDAGALPRALEPGDRLSIPVTWTPTREGFFSGIARVRITDRPLLTIGLAGTGFTAEQVAYVDVLAVSPSSRETGEFFFDVPANAISFTIEAYGGTRSSPSGGPIFPVKLTGPGGRTYVDPATPHGGPYRFERNFPGQSLGFGGMPFAPVDFAVLQVPNTDNEGSQLAPGGGTYACILSNEGGTLSAIQVRVIVERRTGNTTDGHVDLNVFLAPGLAVTASTAPTDPHLQTLLGRADTMLRQTGVGFGDVTYYQLNDPQFDTGNPFNPGLLFRQSSIAAEPRLNVFLVKRSASGVAGLTGAIPCPRVNGSPTAGVFVIGDELLNPDDLGTVLAHEIGHALGLGHTREAFGSGVPWTFDLIDDTCPGAGCVGDPASYLMDANPNVQASLRFTAGQAAVIRRSTLVDPGRPFFRPGATFSANPQQGSPQQGSPLLARVAFSCTSCIR
ncbi:MAG: hypothetical protein AAGD14_12740 [Planctomycetota bacterium]